MIALCIQKAAADLGLTGAETPAEIELRHEAGEHQVGGEVAGVVESVVKTKARALEKLASFDPRIGHPVKYIDYSTLEVKRGDLLGKRVLTDKGDKGDDAAKGPDDAAVAAASSSDAASNKFRTDARMDHAFLAAVGALGADPE